MIVSGTAVIGAKDPTKVIASLKDTVNSVLNKH